MNDGEYVKDQVARLSGPEADNAFFNLLEMPASIHSKLVSAYRTEADGPIRAAILEVIWRHGSDESLPFLVEALNDSYDEVWKRALDGIVSIGGSKAIRLLEAVRADSSTSADRIPWIDEAIEQLRQQIA